MKTGFPVSDLPLRVRSCLPRATARTTKVLSTKDAKTTQGIFIVHPVADEYYYEIPKISSTRVTCGMRVLRKRRRRRGFGRTLLPIREVRWRLRGERVLLSDVDYAVTADHRTPLAYVRESVEHPTPLSINSNGGLYPPGNPVIDNTAARSSWTSLSSASRTPLGAGAIPMAARTFVEHISAGRKNLVKSGRNADVDSQRRRTIVAGRDAAWRRDDCGAPGMVRLPENADDAAAVRRPCRLFRSSRLQCGRAGREDPGHHPESLAAGKEIWRGDLDPVKPIISPRSCDACGFQPWIRKAVEEWEPAFEAAGTSNAIHARMAPGPFGRSAIRSRWKRR